MGFIQEEIDDLLGRTIAKKLAAGFFVIGDAVLFDEGDEIVLCVAGEGRNTKARVVGEKIIRR